MDIMRSEKLTSMDFIYLERGAIKTEEIFSL